MQKSEGSVIIHIPIETVFNAVADPEEMTHYVSSALAGFGGKSGELESYAEWTYPVAGMKLNARTTVSEVEKPYRLIQEMTGAMKGKWTWNLEQEEQDTKVDYCIEYNVPGGILGKVADALFLGRMNRKNLEKTLLALKAYCENEEL